MVKRRAGSSSSSTRSQREVRWRKLHVSGVHNPSCIKNIGGSSMSGNTPPVRKSFAMFRRSAQITQMHIRISQLHASNPSSTTKPCRRLRSR
jgi:hypothetical protein